MGVWYAHKNMVVILLSQCTISKNCCVYNITRFGGGLQTDGPHFHPSVDLCTIYYTLYTLILSFVRLRALCDLQSQLNLSYHDCVTEECFIWFKVMPIFYWYNSLSYFYRHLLCIVFNSIVTIIKSKFDHMLNIESFAFFFKYLVK
jgi:hypothetical protein